MLLLYCCILDNVWMHLGVFRLPLRRTLRYLALIMLPFWRNSGMFMLPLAVLRYVYVTLKGVFLGF